MSERVVLSDRQVDLVTRDVTQAGHDVVRLTTKEAELLAYLASRAGEDVPRGDLLSDVWGYAPTARTRAVDFTVRRLRQKVEPDPKEPTHILTVHGVGYRFEVVHRTEEDAPAEAVNPGVVQATERATVGRQHELRAIGEAFAAGARLVTLLGPVGVGKTHLAREVASASSPSWAGAWWCAVPEDGEVGSAVSEALALQPSDDAARQAGRTLRRAGPCLVVLDGVDGERDGLTIAGWLATAPSLRMIATSRERLGVRGEHVLSLGPLDAEASAALLAGFGVDDSVIDGVVEQLDGLPLALVLAARTGSNHAVGDGRDAIFEALDQAWARLPEERRTAWTQLCTCPGGVDLDTAEQLLGADFINQLEGLQDQGLVRATDGVAGLRFVQLETVRRYGLQRLGKVARSQRTSLRDLLDARWWPKVRDAVRLERAWVRGLSAERQNLLESWHARVTDPVLAARAAVLVALGDTKHPAQCIDRLDEAQALLTDPADLLCLLRARARLRRIAGRLQDAVSDSQHAAAIAQQLGTPALEGLALRETSRCLRLLGDLQGAREACELSRDRLAQAGLRTEAGLVMGLMGQVLHDLGETEMAERALRDAVHLARLEGLAGPRVGALTALGTLQRHQGQLDACEQSYRDAAKHADMDAHPDLYFRLQRERGCLHLERSELPQAEQLLASASVALQELGRARDVAEGRLALSGTRWSLGNVDGALEDIEAALQGFTTAGDALHIGLCLAWGGAAAAAVGDVEEAAARLDLAKQHLEPLAAAKGMALLHACRAHLDVARGLDVVDDVRAWACQPQDGTVPETWGDVRQAVRLLGGDHG